MKTEVLRSDHPIAIPHAIDILKHDGLVAFPTDTVYGLAALPFTAATVERLYAVKGRSSDRAIAVLLGDVDQLGQISPDLGEKALRLAEKFWPGPLTLIVPRRETLPDVLSAMQTVGVRIPDHPVALQLLRAIGPLAVTSANLSGQDNANTAHEVLAQLKGRIHLIIDGGRTPGGQPSTVVDTTGDEIQILRTGPVTADDIRRVMG